MATSRTTRNWVAHSRTRAIHLRESDELIGHLLMHLCYGSVSEVAHDTLR